jgi:autoinducer 2-degrading protein
MHVTLVHIHVKSGYRDVFIEATGINHVNSIQEAGNLRFDVLQDAENPDRFILYEAYKDADAAAAHKQTSHYLKWRDTVAEMMADPRQGVSYVGLYPQL